MLLFLTFVPVVTDFLLIRLTMPALTGMAIFVTEQTSTSSKKFARTPMRTFVSSTKVCPRKFRFRQARECLRVRNLVLLYGSLYILFLAAVRL